MDVRKPAAELAGSFLFFTIGYLSVAAIGNSGGAAGLLVVPFSFGFGLLAAIFAFGHISGGHFNPAVTLAMLLDKRTTPMEAVAYTVAQVAGAILAGLVVTAATSQQAVAAGVTKPAANVTDVGALLIETVLTAGFVAVILAVSKKAPAIAGLVIPLTLVAIHFASATLSGASVNPARSLGSAIVGVQYGGIWIYIVGPMLGAVIGWAAWHWLGEGKPEAA